MHITFGFYVFPNILSGCARLLLEWRKKNVAILVAMATTQSHIKMWNCYIGSGPNLFKFHNNDIVNIVNSIAAYLFPESTSCDCQVYVGETNKLF